MTASIFYLGFIAGAYPLMMLAQRYPIEKVASIVVVVWGLCLILTTVCRNYRDIYAQRFFLGFLESGISPLFMVIVVSWTRAPVSFRDGGRAWVSLTKLIAGEFLQEERAGYAYGVSQKKRPYQQPLPEVACH